MKKPIPEPDDERLRSLLRGSFPEPELNPGFQQSVWRRIETAETRSEVSPLLGWVESALVWLARPRLAIATVAALVVLGGSLGVMNGVASYKQTAEQRYVASVSPLTSR